MMSRYHIFFIKNSNMTFKVPCFYIVGFLYVHNVVEYTFRILQHFRVNY